MIQNVTTDESSTDDMDAPAMRPVPMRPVPMRPVPMRPVPMRPAMPMRQTPKPMGPAPIDQAPMDQAPKPAPDACPPCPPCATEGEPKESFFSKLSPSKLETKLIETQNNVIEGSKAKLSESIGNAKAGLANKINGILGQPTVAAAGGGRRTKRRKKSKRTKKRTMKRRSKKMVGGFCNTEKQIIRELEAQLKKYKDKEAKEREIDEEYSYSNRG